VTDRLDQARAHLARIDAERQAKGAPPIPPEAQDAAARLLVDLWAAAERHGITPDSWGWDHHLPAAAWNCWRAPHRKEPRAVRRARNRAKWRARRR
jgi:hypothetical protein